MIYYFSGTGNSHYVAEVLSKSLQDTMQSIESAQSIKQDKIIGIVTPVYFFGLPDIVKDFLERLSVSPKSYFYLVVTYGGKPGNIGKEANSIMQKKGTGFYAMYGVKMVDTYIPMYDASKNEKVESQIDPQIEEIITQIKERRIGDYLKGTVPVLINKACSFQYKQIRKTDNLTIDESCIHCGLCAKECPEQAIEIKDHVTFIKEQCMMCLRCLHHCPVNAIRFKNKDKGQYRRLL